MKPDVQHFFDSQTSTLTYVVYDPTTKDAVIIDPVLNFDAASGNLTDESIKEVLGFVKDKNLYVHYVLETHAHADHLTGAFEIRKRINHVKVGIGKHITKVQDVFKGVFNLKDLASDGSQFDVLLDEDKHLKAGSLSIQTIFTPGHTPACASYLIGDALFTGDALFMPDFGTGRCDFPAGSAKDLYHSVHDKLYQLPDDTRVYTGHDYQPGGRALAYESTIGKNKQENIQLKADTTEDQYVSFRTQRDATLKAPKLLLPSIQVNIRGGKHPEPEDNGTRYLKIPLKGL